MNRAVFSTARIVRNTRDGRRVAINRNVRRVTISRRVRTVTAVSRGRNVQALRAGGGEGFSGGRGHERRAFEQAAEILFARVLMFAVGELEIGGGFITDFKPFEMNNADVDAAAFPDLALLKFQDQGQSARIFSAVMTCSAEPVKLYLNFPALRVT
jgi:hypothetical protein